MKYRGMVVVLLLSLMLAMIMTSVSAIAESSLLAALTKAQKDAGETTTTLVNEIDLDEFASYYGLKLSEEEETLIRIALMSYSNGAILEHPVGINSIQHATVLEDPYVGNKNSKKFHYSWCSSVSDMKEKNKVTFSSREDAISEGFAPCKKCNP